LAGRRDRAGRRGARPDPGRGARTRGTDGTGGTAAAAHDGVRFVGTSHPRAGQGQRPPDQSLVAGPEETAKSR